MLGTMLISSACCVFQAHKVLHDVIAVEQVDPQVYADFFARSKLKQNALEEVNALF